MPQEIISPGFVMLRCPSLSPSLLSEIRGGYSVKSPDIPNAHLEFISAAISLASPNLYRKFFLEKRLDDEKNNLEIYKYLVRMSTRAAPFGLFSGVFLAELSANTNIKFRSTQNWRADLVPDRQYISKLREQRNLMFDVNAENQGQNIFLNLSAWIAPDGIRFLEHKPKTGELVQSRIDHNDAISLIWHACKKRVSSVGELSKGLNATFGHPESECRRFVNQLIETQLLKTVDNFLFHDEQLIAGTSSNRRNEVLEQFDVLSQHHPNLRRKSLSLDASVQYLNHQMQRQKESRKDLRHTHGLTLHIGASKSTIDKTLIERTLEDLWDMSPLFSGKESRAVELEKLQSNFLFSYGQNWVPLLQAIDGNETILSDVHGFGYKSEFTNEIGLRAKLQSNHNATVQNVLLKNLIATRVANSSVLEIDSSDIVSMGAKTELPSTGAVLGSFVSFSSGQEGFDVLGIHGSPSSRLLSRFAVGNDKLKGLLRNFHNQYENNLGSDYITADVLYEPYHRVANALMRPRITDFVIGMIDECANSEHTLQLRDLYLTVFKNRFVLLHRPSGQFVQPYLNSAHVPRSSECPHVYKFLALLQNQGYPQLSAIWREELAELNWHPEIVFKSIRIARETWNFNATSTQLLKYMSKESLIEKLESQGIPTKIRIVQGDQYLDLNISNELDREILHSEISTSKTLKIEKTPEYLIPIESREGISRAPHEIVIPFASKVVSSTYVATPSIFDPDDYLTLSRKWIDCHIYSHSADQDKLLSTIAPAIEHLISANSIEKYFFIRYDIPSSHIRLRLKASSGYSNDQLLEKLLLICHQLTDESLLSWFEVRKYLPEAQKFGGLQAYELCEKLFFHESCHINEAMRRIQNCQVTDKKRFDLVYYLLLETLAAAFTSSTDALNFAALKLNRYELIVEENSKSSFKKFYREHRPKALDVNQAGNSEFSSVSSRIRYREQLKSIFKELRDVLPRKLFEEVLISITHMTVARVCSSLTHVYEAAALKTFIKQKKSQIARDKYDTDRSK